MYFVSQGTPTVHLVPLSSVKCRELWERLGVIQALSFLSNLSSDFREFDWFCFTRITNSTAMVLHIFALVAFSRIKFTESCKAAWSDRAFKLVWFDCEAPFLFNGELWLLVNLILFLRHHQEYCLFLHWLHCQVGRAVRQLGLIGSRPFPSFPTRALVLCAAPARRKAPCHPTCSHSHNVTPDLSSSACHQSEKGTFSHSFKTVNFEWLPPRQTIWALMQPTDNFRQDPSNNNWHG